MKQFLRNFRKQKFIGTLNILTLAIGIMVSLIVGLWAINEFTFDDFHPDRERIYRSVLEIDMNNKRETVPLSVRPYGRKAKSDLPPIEDVCQLLVLNTDQYNVDSNVTINDVVHNDADVIMSDRNFFTFFNFPLKEGDAASIFSAGDNIVISESAALKYFPDGRAMGEKISVIGKDFFVGGIMYDMPSNSHLRADMVFPLFGYWDENSEADIYTTYFKVRAGTDIGKMETELTSILKEVNEFHRNKNSKIMLEPLKDIHFSKHAMFDLAVKGDRNMVLTFIMTALVILIISCINFINLFISTSFVRAKSIGIMKSQGAGRGALMRQLYGETFIYALLAVSIGILLTILILPMFNGIVNSHITIGYDSPVIYLFCAVLLVTITLLAGSFPAIYMTGFGIMETLRSRFQPRKVSVLQKSLIIFQFSGSIFLLILVIFFGRQISYMLNRDLGFDTENIIYLDAKGDFGRNFETLREELMREPSITDVTMKIGSPIKWQGGIIVRKDMNGEEILFEQCLVWDNYFDFMQMEIVEGENPFVYESSGEQYFCVLNQRAVQLLGLEDPVGKTVITWGNTPGPVTIKGVVRDAQVRSFHRGLDPQLYHNRWQDWDPRTLFFKVSGNPADAIAAIKKNWEESVPKVPFEYHFLDDSYRALYDSEMNARKVLGYALAITIFITVSGLFAMTYYSIQRRIKEIAIRKINGAGMNDLLLLLNKDIAIWTLISFIIAAAISYFFLRNWLEGFVVRIALSPWIFLAAGLFAFAVALLTISSITWKAANANPADSIKRE